MTFSRKEMKNVTVDNSDFYYPIYDGDTVTVKILGLEDFFNRAYQIDLDNHYTDGWVNIKATIDPVEERVTEVYFETELNEAPEEDRVMWVTIKYKPEGEAFYRHLCKDAPELKEFVQECAKMTEQGKEDLAA